MPYNMYILYLYQKFKKKKVYSKMEKQRMGMKETEKVKYLSPKHNSSSLAAVLD